MKEVHDVMGLSSAGDSSGLKPTFSNDVLRLEIAGPDQEHLSVVDVPGIFKSTTAGLTTKADIALVKNMVLGYMKNPRSIMLTVIPANVDVATQEILELATDVDPDGNRTLGVLTKPDLVDKGAEPRVIDLVEGRTQKMKLGWHIVRNPGQQHLSDVKLQRVALEMDFFRSVSPWSSIDKDKVGVESLRVRLKEVLSGLIKTEFPRVQQEIRKRLNDAQRKLNGLGAERSSYAAQVAFLTEVATNFQRLVTLALSASHGADDAFNAQASLRIAPAAKVRMELYSRDMALHGQVYSFLPQDTVDAVPQTTTPQPAGLEWTPELGASQSGRSRPAGAQSHSTKPAVGQSASSTFRSGLMVSGTLGIDSIPDPDALWDTRKEEDMEVLLDILHPNKSLSFTARSGIEDWLSLIYHGNRGFELGTWNTAILATTMKKQAAKWEDISLAFVSDVIVMVHRFINAALDSVCAHVSVRNTVLAVLSEGLIARYDCAIKHTNFLLKVENDGVPMTLNHYFSDNLDKSHRNKALARLKKSTIDSDDHGEVVLLQHALDSYPKSNTEHTVQEIHDNLQAYYKVTRKTFVDNVCKQAADHFLLNGSESPLRYFSPLFVSHLTPQELDSIAGEAPTLKRERAQLVKEIGSLAEAKKILAKL